MGRFASWALGIVIMLASAHLARAVEIKKQKDGSFLVNGKTYTAVVDADGNFTSLKIDGTEFWNTAKKGGKFPGGMKDTLAAAPGILALYNLAEKSPWKRGSIERGGHQYFPRFQQFQRELATYLQQIEPM